MCILVFMKERETISTINIEANFLNLDFVSKLCRYFRTESTFTIDHDHGDNNNNIIIIIIIIIIIKLIKYC